MGNLPVINAFWVGPRLGKLHAACLQSFARAGHRVVLHTYDKPEDAPKGVEIADASLLLDRDKIIRYRKSGSFALTANLFRYELMTVDAGVYVDCDCYCVRPIEDDDSIFGWESDTTINVSVLKIPSDSPLLAAMRSIAPTRGFIPPWEKPRRRRNLMIRSALGWPKSLPELPWGTTGPSGFTHYAQQLGWTEKARPIDEYYPVHFYQTNLLRDPDIRLEDIITPRTKAVHLWNEFLRKQKAAAPSGSPLAVMMGSLE